MISDHHIRFRIKSIKFNKQLQNNPIYVTLKKLWKQTKNISFVNLRNPFDRLNEKIDYFFCKIFINLFEILNEIMTTNCFTIKFLVKTERCRVCELTMIEKHFSFSYSNCCLLLIFIFFAMPSRSE